MMWHDQRHLAETRDCEMKISDYREEIDELDRRLVALLAQREQLVRLIHTGKSHAREPLYSPEREQEVLSHVRHLAVQFGLSESLVVEIYLKIVRNFLEPGQEELLSPPEVILTDVHHAENS